MTRRVIKSRIWTAILKREQRPANLVDWLLAAGVAGIIVVLIWL